MATYFVGNIQIHDREGYGGYEAGFMEVFQNFRGKLLAVDENQKVVEGDWPATRTVVVEFASEKDAMAWYESDAYQALKQKRVKASTCDAALITGFPSESLSESS